MSLMHDIVEEILERLPVHSAVRFKLVSKQWKTTIESQRFKENHMIRRQQQSRELEFLLIHGEDNDAPDNKKLTLSQLVMKNDEKLEVEDSPHFEFHLGFGDISKSIDGLVCLYDLKGPIDVINPVTSWKRAIPKPGIQEHVTEKFGEYVASLLGFGKDTCTKSYKLVWLYNSLELDLAPTTCEIFDFNVDNTWRQVESPSYCRVINYHNPIYLNGLLHWLVFMNDTEIKILSFDCHTEGFKMISSDPQIAHKDDIYVVMCTLNGRLCVSEKWWPRQEIKTLNPTSMKWEKTYTLDISFLDVMAQIDYFPLDVLKNDKLFLFDEHDCDSNLSVYDLATKAYYQYYEFKDVIRAMPYSQSLISID